MDETMSVLPGRAVLAVGGEARVEFLDGLLSARVAGRRPGELVYSALLSPQGKVVTDVMAFVDETRIALDVPTSAADELLRRLTMYKLRAAVSLSRTDEAVLVGPAGTPDPRADGLGGRALASEGAVHPATQQRYHAARIEAGVPDAVDDFALGEAFPHEANMDLTGGVDFTKGCFVGQEVVSRMRHRGTARRRTVIVETDEALPGSGTPITCGGAAVGRLGTVLGRRGLAVVRIDRTGAAASAGDVPIRLSVPQAARAAFALADQPTPA